MKLIMKVHLNTCINEYKQIYRKIEVDDNSLLEDFCEYLIVSFHGKAKYPYQLLLNNGKGPVYISREELATTDTDISIYGKKLSDLKLKKKNKLILNYDFINFGGNWDFAIEVLDIENSQMEVDFQVVDGAYYGISERMGENTISILLDNSDRKRTIDAQKYYLKKYKIDNFEHFNLEEMNHNISKFKTLKKQMLTPKIFEIDAKLVGFEKEIKRKFRIGSSIDLRTFCECVILAFNGDLSHCYTIKRNKEYLDEELFIHNFNYLELQENQRLTVMYDYGDSWEFSMQIKKIIQNDEDTSFFEVIKGKGYGIVDDCGGVWGLEELFNGNNQEWGEYDINEFSLEEVNKEIKKYLKQE